MIYQQLNSQHFHIGTSAHDDWCEEKGALDTEAPGHDPKTHRARWVAETRTWDIRTNEEWEAELQPAVDDEGNDIMDYPVEVLHTEEVADDR